MTVAAKHCAIYTRKSSEDGLEQDFNSLDAQREACQAYITSQKSEGWVALKEYYDDGGFSGGNMERPALKKLQQDIKAGKVNIVVVYKIDRLTRSLMDFSKLVEVFDGHDVTFVSVTQSFNTTTSMGRLTLNVLLSFAQFEREVTGERIRDKVAASKKKGMWMGGARPTGYEIKDKQLIIQPEEAEVVKVIFDKYLEFGCVRKLKAYLDKKDIKTKLWTSRKGITYERRPFCRGILYKMLSNPIYTGRVRHKGNIYEGQHTAIISQDVWDRAQEKMAEGIGAIRGNKKPFVEDNLLKGILFDYRGNPYSPIFTGKTGRQYRYYVSQIILQDGQAPSDVIGRVPAHDMETLVERALSGNLSDINKAAHLLGVDPAVDGDGLKKIVKQHQNIHFRQLIPGAIANVVIHPKAVHISIRQKALMDHITKSLCVALENIAGQEILEISIPFEPIRSRRSFMIPVPEQGNKDPFDIPAHKLKSWVKGVAWRNDHFAGVNMTEIAARNNCGPAYVQKLIYQSFEMA